MSMILIALLLGVRAYQGGGDERVESKDAAREDVWGTDNRATEVARSTWISLGVAAFLLFIPFLVAAMAYWLRSDRHSRCRSEQKPQAADIEMDQPESMECSPITPGAAFFGLMGLELQLSRSQLCEQKPQVAIEDQSECSPITPGSAFFGLMEVELQLSTIKNATASHAELAPDAETLGLVSPKVHGQASDKRHSVISVVSTAAGSEDEQFHEQSGVRRQSMVSVASTEDGSEDVEQFHVEQSAV